VISGRFGYKVLANKYNTMTHKQNCSLLNQYGRGGNPCDCGATERDWEKKFVEKGANLEHERWARWQKHMFSKGTIVKAGLHEGDLIIPAEFVDRWFRQIETTYDDLSEPEKESDRKETRNYLPLIKEIESSAEQRGREEVSGEYALSLIPEEKDMSNESIKLHTFSEAGFILGWNACRKAMIDKINSGE